MATYAVSWQETGRPVSSGRLELRESAVVLEGRGRREVPYEDLAGFRLGRSGADRLAGRPSLVLELHDETALRIWSVLQPAVLAELAERLSLRVA